MVKRDDGPAIPRPGEGKRGEGGYFGYLLRQAGGAYRLRMERALADLEVTPPQFAALTMIAAYPGLSGADLARLAVLTPQTVSVIIANLERAGSVTRHPHPVHGRILTLEITDSGKALLARCRERVQVLEKALAAGLTPEEETVIRRWLAAVAAEGGEPD
ncbi:MarR family winged helix-turn-helix transcriptional regulator [Inquilinus limosus]|uniref:MarR family transcriptional regulator n=1 Tax=Inquilinus limosus MP06 TaxID=1398085 RepID=A0A0A0D3G0_9PROT|nr:MarR family transcriptional regulator [Inquilinus limosus]KGM31602.1 MarR family transcriptional regulator [Inquilinus limosus MP06]